MQVFIVFGLGLGDDETHWEVVEVKLTEADAKQLVDSLTTEYGCEYKYEEFTAT